MRHLITIILFFLVGYKIFAQNSFGQVVAEQEYYDFFNSFINVDSIKEFNLSSQPEFSYILEDTSDIFNGGDYEFDNDFNINIINKDTIFSQADIAFINHQLTSGQKFKWTEGKILGANIIQRKELDKYFKKHRGSGWDKYYKKYKDGFATYSIPLFSLDKTKCIVYRGGHCGGLCGGGRVSLFIRINGKWEEAKVYTIWVS